MSAPVRTLTVRHIQLLRALFAAVAALMITFSSDHSAVVGLAVFGGFAGATALIHALCAWLVAPAGTRWSSILLAVIGVLVSFPAGVASWRTDAVFFALVISWAAVTGLIELLAGLQARRRGLPSASDAITVGALGLLLAVVLLIIPVGYVWKYTIEDAGTFNLTGIILAVGIFGGYAAILAVFLAIAGFSPRRASGDDVGSPTGRDAQSIADATTPDTGATGSATMTAPSATVIANGGLA